jgi:hypothetical protein
VPFVLKNQRTVLNRRTGNVTFLAWTVSVLLHLLILAVFSFVKLSRPANATFERSTPTAKINLLTSAMEKGIVIAKPKIKKPSGDRNFSNRSETTKNSSFLVPNSISSENFSPASKTFDIPNYSLVDGGYALGGIEFFGSGTYERKICYIVDCSGSMQGMMGQVQQQLKDSIKNLVPDQYFYVIFFGNGKLYEFGNGKLVRASQQNKMAAYDFISTIRAGGSTNAYKALERAIQIEDGFSNKASVYYFLTDGFELSNDESESLYKKTARLIKRFAPDSKINTIGFWPTDQDRTILKGIASLSGGKSVFVTEGDF